MRFESWSEFGNIVIVDSSRSTSFLDDASGREEESEIALVSCGLSNSQRRAHRKGATITPPEEPGWERQDEQPKQQRGTGFGKKKDEREETLEGAAEAIDDRVAKLHRNRGGGGGELGLYSAASLKLMVELKPADARTPFLQFVPRRPLE